VAHVKHDVALDELTVKAVFHRAAQLVLLPIPDVGIYFSMARSSPAGFSAREHEDRRSRQVAAARTKKNAAFLEARGSAASVTANARE
jgi:hypothetical protein